MKATVVGGKGFIGQHLAQHLNEIGWDCWIPERDDPRLYTDDLGCVFYCAGLTSDFLSRMFDTIDAHICLLNKIINKSHFDSLIYLSSTRIYDGTSKDIAYEDTFFSFNPSLPRHLYDLSKVMGESICLASQQGKVRIARLSCVYKDQQDHDGFLSQLLRDVFGIAPESSKSLLINSSADAVRDYVYLEDVIQALVLIATKGKYKIYNVASGENISNKMLFNQLRALTGIEIIASSDYQRGASEVPLVSISRLKQEFGWKPISVLEKIKEITRDHYFD
jgi:nucleoside-diphosphate-sugar epimerase